MARQDSPDLQEASVLGLRDHLGDVKNGGNVEGPEEEKAVGFQFDLGRETTSKN